MSSLNSTVSPNTAFVRPQFFYINGFSNIPHVKYYYIFLCFVYAVTVFANFFIIFIIYTEKSLHTPKYVAVLNLAVVDICGSTALIPKLIHTFLFDSQFITYEACLANMFFVHFFTAMPSLCLVVLAYDRFVAICFPLRYHIIMTNTSMFVIIVCVWVFIATLVITLVFLVTRLSFCRSIVVESYFCDHGPLYRMACNDNSPSSIQAKVNITVSTFIPFILVVLSYVCILSALLKIASGDERLKAMKTCTPHFILVILYYIPFFITYIAALMSVIHPNTRIICSSLSSTIPPMLNPIIYTLKTEEIIGAIRKLYKINKIQLHPPFPEVRRFTGRRRNHHQNRRSPTPASDLGVTPALDLHLSPSPSISSSRAAVTETAVPPVATLVSLPPLSMEPCDLTCHNRQCYIMEMLTHTLQEREQSLQLARVFYYTTLWDGCACVCKQ
ncbi:olfactory receptor 52E4-like [Amia ocellicauda]|uniref:olfactory receptor 52E4-like n=1 Tax=Amia ocellicauda TaxID=2972642 RepID=UPI0034640DE0